MPSPKEKPKGAKTKKNAGKAAARSQPAISAKQAAKLLKDKYVQQLDQRQPESGSAEVQAVDQVEGAGSWAVNELLTHERPRSDRQPDKRIRERPRDVPETAGSADTPASAPEGESPPPHQTNTSPRQSAGPSPKERAVQVKGQHPPAAPAEHPAPSTAAAPADTPARTTQIKERPTVRLKEQRARTAPSIKEKPSSLSNQSIPSIKSIRSIPSPNGKPVPAAAGSSNHPAGKQPGVGSRSIRRSGRAAAKPASSPAAPDSSVWFKREARRQTVGTPRPGLSQRLALGGGARLL